MYNMQIVRLKIHIIIITVYAYIQILASDGVWEFITSEVSVTATL